MSSKKRTLIEFLMPEDVCGTEGQHSSQLTLATEEDRITIGQTPPPPPQVPNEYEAGWDKEPVCKLPKKRQVLYSHRQIHDICWRKSNIIYKTGRDA
jgi:hypothetical protein